MPSRKRKKKESALRDAPSHKADGDDTGLKRFLTIAFRKAVEATGPVIAVVLEKRR
jgi:hypothetical protein